MREFWKKRLPALALAVLMLAGTAVPAAADNEDGSGTGTEQPSENVHHFGDWICQNDGEHIRKCTDTGCDKTETAPHSFKIQNNGESGHTISCEEECNYSKNEAHSLSEWQTTKEPTVTESGTRTRHCTVKGCDYTEEETLAPLGHQVNTSEWKMDDSKHWNGCNDTSCTEHHNEAAHSLKYTQDKDYHWQVCSVCGWASTKKEKHNYGSSYASDSTNHWQICSVCRAESEKTAHKDANGDGICDVCKYGGMAASTKYTVTFINAGSTFNTQKNLVKDAKPSNPGTPTRTGSNCTYSFRGWTTSNPGSAAAYTGQTILSSAQVAAKAVTGNITYYAVYTVTATNRNTSLSVNGTNAATVGTDVRSKINSQFSSVAGRNFVSVTFSSVGSTSYGTLFANSGRTTLTGRTYSYTGGSYPVTDLYFVPSGTRGTYTVTYSANDGYTTVQGTLSITTSASASTKISYSVRAGERVALDRNDFNSVYQSVYSETVRYVRFTSVSSFSTSDGAFYYNYGSSGQREFSRSDLRDYDFYYSSDNYGSYPIRDISFAAASGASKGTITLNFRAYYASNRYVDGTLEIQINGSGTGSAITYQVRPGERVELDRSDFNRVFADAYSNYELRYVNFLSGGSYAESDGSFYYNYGERDERSFSKSNLTSYSFYYSSSKYGDYALDDLSFLASDSFSGSVTLNFRAYYDSSRYTDGTLTLRAAETTRRGDIRYSSAGGANVQLNPNDFARFLNRTYSGAPLQSVKLNGVPDTGTLYYNYYGVSAYGASSLRLTSSNCGSQLLYFSPSGINQYSLGELTYIPSGSNYCVTIPFTAYSTNNRSVQGSVLISVNNVTVQDVYGPTPMNTAVSFPADSIYNAVAASTSNAQLYSIQLLELPASSKGTIYVGTGSTKAATSARYTYSANSGNGRIRDLRFVPATGFTGSVEIPYVAYSSADRAIASGRLCLGVVKGLKSYRDVNSSTWCYKYVAELSDEKVIDGYPDGYFRPDKTVTYGQALKLIMLAADYSVQNPTGKHPFSGYLSRATKDGLVSGVKESDLDRPISRLAVAQITAKAMHLSLSNLSSVKPFTDTSDVYVQALNAAGIVEGYFSNGTSTFKPANTMTRGQISAIVWRMDRAQ